MAHIDWGIVCIIGVALIVTPGRIPIAVVEVIVTASDQFNAMIALMIIVSIVPFRMIRTKDFVLRALPLLGAGDPVILLKRDRGSFVRARLRFETCMLLFDLLDLLRLDAFAASANSALPLQISATGSRVRCCCCVRSGRARRSGRTCCSSCAGCGTGACHWSGCARTWSSARRRCRGSLRVRTTTVFAFLS